MSRAGGAAGLVLAAALAAGAGTPPAGAVGVTRVVVDGVPRVAWTGARDSLSPVAPDTAAAARARWRTSLADPARAPTALRVLADLRAAAGDSAGADSCWRALSAATGPWQWEALQRVAEEVRAARGPGAADSMLAPVARDAWTDAERAAWLERRARWLAAAGDTVRAGELARQLVMAYPGVVGPAARGFALLDSLAAARRDSLPLEVLRLGAEIDVFRAARPAAIAKLRRVLARSPGPAGFAAALRLAEVLRSARMPVPARAAARTAQSRAADPDQRARARLEEARALRDAARTDSALALYARVAGGPAGPALRSTAWWEYGREAQDRGRYREALPAFERVATPGDRRADEARFQAGLMLFVLGEADSACAWWREARGEGARFWLAIATRAKDRAAGDSLLRALAVLPGYGFYRAAARETLGVRGWPAATDSVAAPPADAPAIAPDVRALLDAGRPDAAAGLLGRFAAGDARAGADRSPGAGALLGAAALAFEAGRPALGTRLAERAVGAAADDSAAWAIVPWAYPPAWSEAVALAATPEVDPALLWALARQESRFDPRARSRSDALGLTQLKRGAALDAARAGGEPLPEERDLFDPGRSLRLGARYLSRLVRRFDGRVPVALAAYNAGPANVRADWRALVARGGEALYCELASNADSQDYVRRIVGFRQAYRELAPFVPGAAGR